ncbi:unnamed protein product [Adineta ricciae]|uniref:Uncharacterized protein n=2 Tax=Adineta ricciae TaxID=249248 RepID=A0A815L1W5_ADIRI|nr:unnamed protein product [Adineta ricciae]
MMTLRKSRNPCFGSDGIRVWGCSTWAAKIEDIKVSVASLMNLYRTLSAMIHNSTVPYEDDKLPILDIVDGQFTRQFWFWLLKTVLFDLSCKTSESIEIPSRPKPYQNQYQNCQNLIKTYTAKPKLNQNQILKTQEVWYWRMSSQELLGYFLCNPGRNPAARNLLESAKTMPESRRVVPEPTQISTDPVSGMIDLGRSDALALASFYKLTLPNIEFEFVTNIVHYSADSTDLFNRMDLNNSLNMSTTMRNESNEQSLKRKLFHENQENEIQLISTSNI